MSKRIVVLSEEIANKIAAGEVVESRLEEIRFKWSLKDRIPLLQ